MGRALRAGSRRRCLRRPKPRQPVPFISRAPSSSHRLLVVHLASRIVWDRHQAALELQEKIDPGARPDYLPPEPKIIPLVLDGLEVVEIDPTDESFQFPENIKTGEGRVGQLNNLLGARYAKLANLMNELSYCKAILLRSEDLVHPVQVTQLKRDVTSAEHRVRSEVEVIVFLIGEIDAIESSDAYFIPGPLLDCLKLTRKDFLVESGSLKRLAEERYFPETCLVPDGIYVGQDTQAGRLNRERKDKFERTAYLVNRVNYLSACNFTGYRVKALQKELKGGLSQVSEDGGDGVLQIPGGLYEEVTRILSEVEEEELPLHLKRIREAKEAEKELKKEWALAQGEMMM